MIYAGFAVLFSALLIFMIKYTCELIWLAINPTEYTERGDFYENSKSCYETGEINYKKG